MMDRLPNDFEVAVKILRYNEKGESVWFSKLVEDLDGRMSRSTVSKNIDQLFDLGIITGEWEKTSDGKWIRTFRIAGEASGLIRSISEKHPSL